MFDSPKERAEKAMALRRLLSKWFKKQETKKKADLLAAKNPELKIMRAQGTKKGNQGLGIG
jgi:hypothetical protein